VNSSVKRILAATDRSETADRAVAWAAEMAERYGAELVLLQVVAPPGPLADAVPSDEAVTELSALATRLAGPHARARVAVDSDPSRAICGAADEEGADVLVVGSVGMSGRKEFLLGNVPNRVSHNAPCTVVIVHTARSEKHRLGRVLGRSR
jgi:ubiquinone biosynthesis protein